MWAREVFKVVCETRMVHVDVRRRGVFTLVKVRFSLRRNAWEKVYTILPRRKAWERVVYGSVCLLLVVDALASMLKQGRPRTPGVHY